MKTAQSPASVAENILAPEVEAGEPTTEEKMLDKLSVLPGMADDVKGIKSNTDGLPGAVKDIRDIKENTKVLPHMSNALDRVDKNVKKIEGHASHLPGMAENVKGIKVKVDKMADNQMPALIDGQTNLNKALVGWKPETGAGKKPASQNAGAGVKTGPKDTGEQTAGKQEPKKDFGSPGGKSGKDLGPLWSEASTAFKLEDQTRFCKAIAALVPYIGSPGYKKEDWDWVRKWSGVCNAPAAKKEKGFKKIWNGSQRGLRSMTTDAIRQGWKEGNVFRVIGGVATTYQLGDLILPDWAKDDWFGKDRGCGNCGQTSGGQTGGADHPEIPEGDPDRDHTTPENSAQLSSQPQTGVGSANQATISWATTAPAETQMNNAATTAALTDTANIFNQAGSGATDFFSQGADHPESD